MNDDLPKDDLQKDLAPKPGEAIDPVELARRDQKKHLPRRFWKQAGVEEFDGRFALTLDGRRARTPAKNALAVHSHALAQALAAEWDALGETIDPAEMPLTRIVNSALDGVAKEMAATLDEIVKYAGSDLLVYRAGDPASLVAEQAAAWDPVLDWARERHGARFILSEGIVFAAQPEASMDAIRRAVAAIAGEDDGAALRLTGLHVMTTLTGSALLALAVAEGFLDAQAAWNAAHVDENFQMRAWGEDAEAMARRERRWKEMEAAARVLGRC
jgi:chaperone required for assembly of F1-ATPase